MKTDTVAPARDGKSADATVVVVGGLECAIVGTLIGTFPILDRVHPLVRYKGHEYTVLDLPRFFAAGNSSGDERLLALFAQGEVRRGLVVHRVSGPFEFVTEELLPIPSVYPQVERDCWRGLLPTSDGRLIAVPYLAGLTMAALAGDRDSEGLGRWQR